MRIRSFTALLFLALLPVAASADDVYLKNGRSFKGVVAETSDSQVQIRLPGGMLSLPSSNVLKVEKSDSSFAEFLRREDAVKHGGRATDWLELARWAKAQGLTQGYREAVLGAADLNPRLEGLAPHMRSLGFVLAEDLDRWIPYEDSMRRRGLVKVDGEWITRAELAQRAKDKEEEARDRRTARLTQDAREAELSLAQLQLYRETMRATAPTATTVLQSEPAYVLPTFGGFFFPPVVSVPPSHPSNRSPHHGGRRDDRTMDGSL
ncbi:MAG TPA: hypothetical protein VGE98_09470, partial [Thermoanaerobaculia bacterium]